MSRSKLFCIFLAVFAYAVSLVISCSDSSPNEPVNGPPAVPGLIMPLHHAENVSIKPLLHWTCSDPDGDSLKYDVYLDTVSTPKIVEAGQKAVIFSPDTLAYNKNCYWKIVAKDGHSDSVVSPTWEFSTGLVPPRLSVSPRNIVLWWADDTSSILITNSGSGILTWAVSTDVDWVGLTPENGQTTSDTSRVLLSAYTGTLLPGNHSGHVLMVSNSGVDTVSFSYVKGGCWTGLGGGTNLKVNALSTLWHQLIVGGDFTSVDGIPANRIAALNGGSWSTLGSGIRGGDHPSVKAMCEFNDVLYAGGDFDSAGSVASKNVAAWDGYSWRSLGDGLGDGSNACVYALTTCRNFVIAGGSFTASGQATVNYIAAWDGTKWNPMAAGTDGDVYAFTSYSGLLVAGGTFTTAGDIQAQSVAVWQGDTWSPLGSGLGGNSEYDGVFALSVYKGKLVAGGTFAVSGEISLNNVSFWNGSAWLPLGRGVSALGDPIIPTVAALIAYDDQLVAGGLFSSDPNLHSLDHVASWDGASWRNIGSDLYMGSGMYHGVLALMEWNGQVVAGGEFYLSGSPEYRIAVWGPCY
jgi:hypothetical protein